MHKRVVLISVVSASLLAVVSACSSAKNLPQKSEESGFNKSLNYESFKDSRDGQIYKTIRIGEQVWMAENLNFKADESYCHGDNEDHCSNFGRLYTWSAAMESCPDGWHLPSDKDWTLLLTTVGGQISGGKILKSASGWLSLGNGTDDYGFSGIPAGVRFDNGNYNSDSAYTFFWSSKEDNAENAYGLFLQYYSERADLNSGLKKSGFSVRCVKGNVRRETRDERREGNLLIDVRDGQTYKTVTIGAQTWMAQNLNFKTDSSSCYNDADSNCVKYGRLYKWEDAMDSAAVFSTNGKGCGYSNDNRGMCTPKYPVRGVCPLGWHIPSLEEWKTLFVAVGGKKWYRDGFLRAGKFLKAKEEWAPSNKVVDVEEVKKGDYVHRDKLDKPISVVGSDDYGFSVLPGGYKEGPWGYKVKGRYGGFWTTDQSNSSFVNDVDFLYDSFIAYWNVSRIEYSRSVRCVKD